MRRYWLWPCWLEESGCWERDSLLPDDSLVAKAHRVKKIEPQAILVMGDGTTINLKDSVSLAALVSMKMALSADEDVLTYTKGSVDTVIEYHTMKIPREGICVGIIVRWNDGLSECGIGVDVSVQIQRNDRRVFLKGEAYFDVKETRVNLYCGG